LTRETNQILTFDDTGYIPTIASPVPNSYGGLNWPNFEYRSSSTGGFANGTVSAPCAAFNGGGRPASITGNRFHFISASFTSAWNDVLQIQVEGLRDGDVLYSRTITASYNQPTSYTFDFLGVDEVRFSSSGGHDANANNSGSGTHFVMDDFATPEPATTSLVAVGGGTSLLLRRRR